LLCGGAGGKNLGKSRSMSRDEVLNVVPQLNADRVSGAVRYFDGMTNDARLVLDSLRSAEASGATLLNYAPLESARREGDLWRCDVQDRLTDTSYEITARCVVNATGAWANSFAASRVKLRLTKGV